MKVNEIREIRRQKSGRDLNRDLDRDLDLMIRRIFKIIPCYYNTGEAAEVRDEILAFIEIYFLPQ